MSKASNFFAIAIEQIDLAVTGLIGWTNIHVPQLGIAKWRIRRASVHLRALEMIVRRLIMLMALEIELEPRPRATGADHPLADPLESKLQSDPGVEIIDFPRASGPRLALLPPLIDFDRDVDFSSFSSPRRTADIKRFARRLIAIRKVLDAPSAHAKRLARSLGNLERHRELTPVVWPINLPQGLSPEVKLLSGGLTVQLRSALKAWDTS
ncbi:MAG: hypothetical protein AAFY34_00720 [Pseudomonadota bacterium]